ncbi:phosphoribosyltransferase family protein [Arthrobacter sp. UYEF20]|uniref:ComF family protein n=1 Tax=Arthrobacter sp. UYEF20 TaxID=1756363 RepID=UPI0033996F4F
MTRYMWLGRRPADPDLAPPEVQPARHRGDYRRGLVRLADRTQAAAAELLALAAPVGCVCCGAEDLVLCGDCARQVRQLTRNPFRAEAQAPALMDMDGSVLLPVVAAGAYRGELAQAVLSFKRYGQAQLGDVLAKALAGAVSSAVGDSAGLWLVPVPTSNSAYRKRGFSPVHLLLRRFSRCGLSGAAAGAGPMVVDALRKAGPLAGARKSPTAASGLPGPGLLGPGLPGPGLPGAGAAPTFGTGKGRDALRGLAGGQKGLGRGARAQRVRGSMRAKGGRWHPELRGRPCIIVDDVLTTGATLAEAARALQLAGAVVRGAVVLAATRPPVASDFGAADGMVAGQAAAMEKNKPQKDE